MFSSNPLMDQQSKTEKVKRKWECRRCKEPINIFVSDEEKKYVIDGDKIYCCRTCRSFDKEYIPVDPARKKLSLEKKRTSKKYKEINKKPIFKCFNCERETNHMTFNHLCAFCYTQHIISKPEEEISPAFKSLIRLSKMN